MANLEKCPICGVPVKAENLRRHVDDTHPRHPEAAAVKRELQEDERYAPSARPRSGPRIRRGHVAIIAAALILIAGGYVAAPYFAPTTSFSVDSCINEASLVYHIHARLSIFIQGSRFGIPWDTGKAAGCTKPLHTHEEYDPATQPAVIHVESPVAREYTLGDFFHVWGQVLTPTQVLTYANDGTNVVGMTVNGSRSTAFGSLELADQQVIEIHYGPVT